MNLLKTEGSEKSLPGPRKTSYGSLSFVDLQNYDLNKEADRRRTFSENGCEIKNIKILAIVGFYLVQRTDVVKCQFCFVVQIGSDIVNNVISNHLRVSPNCPLLRRRTTLNQPISEAELDEILPPASYDVCGTGNVTGVMERPNTVPEGSIESVSEDDVHMMQHVLYNQGGWDAVFARTSNSTLTQSLQRPEHPEYAIEAKRIESYEDWPKTMRQKPQQLSDAGFYYTGKGDRVCCFSCGGGLKDWEENDEPWQQHAMWYSKCEYLKLMKGMEFINEMAKVREELSYEKSHESPSVSSSPNGSQESSLSATQTMDVEQLSLEDNDEPINIEKESKLCKICYVNEYNTIFLPCGHVIACAKCASSVSKCPACRQPFETLTRVYFT
ncbi:unnamed protein product [Diamesa hyperborea]